MTWSTFGVDVLGRPLWIGGGHPLCVSERWDTGRKWESYGLMMIVLSEVGSMSSTILQGGIPWFVVADSPSGPHFSAIQLPWYRYDLLSPFSVWWREDPLRDRQPVKNPDRMMSHDWKWVFRVANSTSMTPFI